MLVYGHRGAAGEAPENTLAGFRHAIDRGVRFFELDLNLSSDGQLVVIHDTTVDRTTSRSGKVESFTAKQLAKLDARKNCPPWPNKKGTGIITLQELLAALPEVTTFQLEVKKRSNKVMRYVAEQLLQMFPDKKSAKGIVVTSMSKSLHKHLSEIAPHLKRGLVSESPKAYLELKQQHYDVMVLNWRVCNKATVQKLHKAGVEVSCWTVNDPEQIKRLYKMGVDSVISDYPSMAIPLMGRLLAEPAA